MCSRFHGLPLSMLACKCIVRMHCFVTFLLQKVNTQLLLRGAAPLTRNNMSCAQNLNIIHTFLKNSIRIFKQLFKELKNSIEILVDQVVVKFGKDKKRCC